MGVAAVMSLTQRRMNGDDAYTYLKADDAAIAANPAATSGGACLIYASFVGRTLTAAPQGLVDL